jgi:hypothetical protein
LNPTIARKKRAPTGVECIVILHAGNRRLNGVNGRSAARKGKPSGGESRTNAALVRGYSIVGHCPGAAMNNQDGLHHDESAESLLRSVSK